MSILRKGKHEFLNTLDTDCEIDQWFWQLSGTSRVNFGDTSNEMAVYEMDVYDSLLVPGGHYKKIEVDVHGDDDFILRITQDPKLKN